MAYGDTSNPARFLYGQDSSDSRYLSLKVFGGEVLTAFDLATIFDSRTETRSIQRGAKSASFPKTWKATAEYHTPGTELLGNDIDTTEIVVTVDDILVSHFAVADLDAMLTHFEVRAPFAQTTGYSLAKVYDKNIARQLILASRTSADGPFPGGQNVTDSSLTNSGAIDGKAWIDAIRDANTKLFNVDVPDEQPRYLAVNKDVFDAIKYSTDANGNYLVLNRDFGNIQAGGVAGAGPALEIDGVTIFKTRNLPTTNETSDTTVYSKYRANYSTTTGILWTPMAIATVKLMDIGFETTRDTRRLEDFTVAKMFVGHGTLRPECAIEFKTS